MGVITVQKDIEVDIELFDTDSLIAELQVRSLTFSEIDELSEIVKEHSSNVDIDEDIEKPKCLWDEQIEQEVNTLLAKMTPLQALEALQNLNK